MSIKQKIFLIIFTFISLLDCALSVSSFNESKDKITVIYISDLNLFHTPFQNQIEKSALEKKFGILVYESQAVFQELIRDINQKLNPDIVIFGEIISLLEKKMKTYGCFFWIWLVNLKVKCL